jgi:hypothetical protein
MLKISKRLPIVLNNVQGFRGGACMKKVKIIEFAQNESDH